MSIKNEIASTEAVTLSNLPVLPLRDVVVYPHMVIPLFVGRLPIVATLEELDEEALVSILTEPKNALTKQFQSLFKMENVELEFRDEALVAIAKKAMERKMGARGLRAILENILLDTMYDLPSLEGVTKVVIDESVVSNSTKPILIYEQDEMKSAAGGKD